MYEKFSINVLISKTRLTIKLNNFLYSLRQVTKLKKLEQSSIDFVCSGYIQRI